MLRFGKTEVGKQRFYCEEKNNNIWDVDVDKIIWQFNVNPKLIETKNNSKYLIRYLD